MPKVLISYRRDDSAAYAGRLFDRLSDSFGPDNIFIDIDAIKPGQDFVQTIGQSVIACDAVLAVIGPRWLIEKDAAGRRRLDRADDLVRMEVATALNRGIQVIPVLVAGAEMPQATDLPDDLSKLARLQALEITDARFHHDVHRLIQALGGAQAAADANRVKPRYEDAPPSRSSVVTRRAIDGLASRWRWGAAALAAVLLLWIAYRQLPAGTRSGFATEPPSSAADAQSAGSPLTRVAASATPPRIVAANVEGIEIVRGAAPPVRPLQGIGTVDQPQPIDLGVTYKFTLEDVDTAFLSVPPVTDLLVVLDMHSAKGETTNLQSELSLLDRDGAVLIPTVISFNEIDHGHRKTGIVAVKQKAPLSLKLRNGGHPIVYTLTAFGTPRIPFVPFFGNVTPGQLAVGQSVSGDLDAGEDAFYLVTLKKGNYRATLDFANVPRHTDNIMGYLAVLDAAGSNQTTVIGLNEIDVSFRKIGGLTVKRDGPAIVRIQSPKPVKYTVRIAPDEAAP